MLEKRIETVKVHVGNIKVTNTKTIKSFKREYSITSSAPGRNRYVVKICCTPSCSCPGFQILRKESHDFDPKFKYVVNRLSKAKYKVNKEEAEHVLARHRLNNQPQKRILHYKENRSAQCFGRRCDVVFTKGSLCLKVTDALTIPFGKEEAVEQLFSFVGKKLLTAEANLV